MAVPVLGRSMPIAAASAGGGEGRGEGGGGEGRGRWGRRGEGGSR